MKPRKMKSYRSLIGLVFATSGFFAILFGVINFINYNINPTRDAESSIGFTLLITGVVLMTTGLYLYRSDGQQEPVSLEENHAKISSIKPGEESSPIVVPSAPSAKLDLGYPSTSKQDSFYPFLYYGQRDPFALGDNGRTSTTNPSENAYSIYSPFAPLSDPEFAHPSTATQDSFNPFSAYEQAQHYPYPYGTTQSTFAGFPLQPQLRPPTSSQTQQPYIITTLINPQITINLSGDNTPATEPRVSM